MLFMVKNVEPPISLATSNSKIESLNQMIQEMHDVLKCAKQRT